MDRLIEINSVTALGNKPQILKGFLLLYFYFTKLDILPKEKQRFLSQQHLLRKQRLPNIRLHMNDDKPYFRTRTYY
jgi:hypothetical protein